MRTLFLLILFLYQLVSYSQIDDSKEERYMPRIDTTQLVYDEDGNLLEVTITHFISPDRKKQVIKTWYNNGGLYRIAQSVIKPHFEPQYLREDSIDTKWAKNGRELEWRYYYEGHEYLSRRWYDNGKEAEFIIQLGENYYIKEWDSSGLIKKEAIYKYPFNVSLYSYVNGVRDQHTRIPNSMLLDEFHTYGYYKDGKIIYTQPQDKEIIEEMLKQEVIDIKKIRKVKRIKGFKNIQSGFLSSSVFPCKDIYMNSFFIQETEVSNKEYRNFYQSIFRDSINVLGREYIEKALYPDTSDGEKVKVKGEKISLNNYFLNTEYDNYPVVGIGYYQVLYYCQWLKNRIVQENALQRIEKYLIVTIPNLLEWEYAMSDGKGFISGLEEQKKLNNFKAGKGKDSFNELVPVKSFRSYKTDLYNMIGNVSEWCRDSNPDSIRAVSGNSYFLWRDLKNNPFIFSSEECPWMTVIGGSYKDSIIGLKDLINVKHHYSGCPYNTQFPKISEVGFRPVIYLMKPEDKVGVAIDCKWYEF